VEVEKPKKKSKKQKVETPVSSRKSSRKSSTEWQPLLKDSTKHNSRKVSADEKSLKRRVSF